MNSVVECSSIEAVAGLLDIVGNPRPILDTTYGNGNFWADVQPDIGMDVNPERARDLCADFTALPLSDSSMACVVYDPPFHPNVGTREEAMFSTLGNNEKELRVLFESGLKECWRVSNHWVLVKCQGYIHNHAPQWMPLWAIAVCGEPFEWLVVTRKHKVISSRWVSNKSLRRNHADYMLFSKRGVKR